MDAQETRSTSLKSKIWKFIIFLLLLAVLIGSAYIYYKSRRTDTSERKNYPQPNEYINNFKSNVHKENKQPNEDFSYIRLFRINNLKGWDMDDSLMILACFRLLFYSDEFREYILKSSAPAGGGITPILKKCVSNYHNSKSVPDMQKEIGEIIDKINISKDSDDLIDEVIKELLNVLKNEIGIFESLRMLKYQVIKDNGILKNSEISVYNIPSIFKRDSSDSRNIGEYLSDEHQLSLSNNMEQRVIENPLVYNTQAQTRYIPGNLILLNFYPIGEIDKVTFLYKTLILLLPEGNYQMIAFISCTNEHTTFWKLRGVLGSKMLNVYGIKTQNSMKPDPDDKMIAPRICLFRKIRNA